MIMRFILLLMFLTAAAVPAHAVVFESHEERITRLEHQIQHVDTFAGAALICAAFCALWAQNTGRNWWLWFFFGLFLSFFAVFVMLYKNAKYFRARKRLIQSPTHS